MKTDLTPRLVEEWLDSHPEFAIDYLARRSETLFVKQRLMSKRRCSMQCPSPANELYKRTNRSSSFCAVSDFDARKYTLTNDLKELKSLRETMDEEKYMIELVKDISSSNEFPTVCRKILEHVSTLINCDRCSLFMVLQPPNEEPYFEPIYFDVTGSTSSSRNTHTGDLKFPISAGIVGATYACKKAICISNAYEYPNFNPEIDRKTNFVTRSVLSVPILDKDSQVRFVAQVINKKNAQGEICDFGDNDRSLFERYLNMCSMWLLNMQLLDSLYVEIYQSQFLLDLGEAIFEKQSDYEELMHSIMSKVVVAIPCQDCTLYIVDEETEEKIISSHHYSVESKQFWTTRLPNQKSKEEALALQVDLVKRVCSEKTTVRIFNPTPSMSQTDQPSLSPEICAAESKRIASLMCAPVKQKCGRLEGVIVFINRCQADCFTEADEHVFSMISVFCGVAICNSKLCKKINEEVSRLNVTVESLNYHLVCSEQQARFYEAAPPFTMDLTSAKFNDIVLDDDGTVLGCFHMFESLGLINRFHIDRKELFSFIASLRNGYRNLPYHNWRHAFGVAQAVYSFLLVSSINNIFSPWMSLAFLVAAMGHDIDHRGTNNIFLQKTSSPLFMLYGKSPLETHHATLTLHILDVKENQFLKHLDTDVYRSVLNLIRELIMATDLTDHLSIRQGFVDIVEDRSFSFVDDQHIALLRKMLITAADLSNVFKEWSNHCRHAHNVAKEFCQQKELEKEIQQVDTSSTDDEDFTQNFPRIQVQFLEVVCEPLLQSLSKLLPVFNEHLTACLENKACWTRKLESSSSLLSP